jgi:Patched family
MPTKNLPCLDRRSFDLTSKLAADFGPLFYYFTSYDTGPEKTDTMAEVAGKTSGEVSSCESAGNSNTSRTASETAPTRAETMDSLSYGEGQDNDLIRPCVSHNNMEEDCMANDSDLDDGASNHSRTLHVSRGPTLPPAPPKSAIANRAYKIHRWWVRVSDKGRGALLRGMVGLAKVSARYPHATVALSLGLSIVLIVGGWMTNFNMRLDNDRIFTPTSSEVWEHSAFLGDSRMYEGVGDQASRRMMGLSPMHHNPGEGFTWRELQRLNRHRALQKLEEDRGLLSISVIDAENYDTFDGTTSTIIEGARSFPTNPTISPSLKPSKGPSRKSSKGPSLKPSLRPASAESYNGTNIPSVSPAPTLAPSAKPQEKTYERGAGSIMSILVHADKQNVFTLEGMEKMWDLLDSLRSSEHFGAACIGGNWSYHDIYGEDTCEIRSVTRFWNHNRTLYNEKVKTEEDLVNTADAAYYEDGGFVDLPFILAEMEEDENGRPVAAQAFFSWVFLKEKDGQFDLLDDLDAVRKRWEDEADDKKNESDSNKLRYILNFSAPDSFSSEVQRAIIEDIPLIPVVFIIMSAFTCLVFYKHDRLKSRCLLGLGAVVTVFMSTLAAYGLMFMCGKLDKLIPSSPACTLCPPL